MRTFIFGKESRVHSAKIVPTIQNTNDHGSMV